MHDDNAFVYKYFVDIAVKLLFMVYWHIGLLIFHLHETILRLVDQ